MWWDLVMRWRARPSRVAGGPDGNKPRPSVGYFDEYDGSGIESYV